MKNICGHCGYLNNNYFYCSGCGLELKKSAQKGFEKLPENSTVFLHEVKRTIDKMFPSQTTGAPSIQINKTGLSIFEISKESGVFLIDNSQWKDVDHKMKVNCFYSDISLTYILSLLLSIIAAYGSSAGSMIFLKIFFASYILSAFLLWFVFPFMTGVSAFSFLGYKCGMFKDSSTSVKGSVATLLVLFIIVMFYSFAPFFLIEYLVASKSDKYVPAAIKAAGVDYFLKIGGE